MRIAAVALSLMLCTQAWAKTHKDLKYQDAVLVSYRDATGSASCTSSGTVKANTDDSGETQGSTSSETNCSNRSVRQYTIQIGSNTFVVVYGYNFLNLHNDLSKQLPGTHIQARADKGFIYIKNGNKEVRYNIIEAK